MAPASVDAPVAARVPSGWRRATNTARLVFYALMCGGLAGMVGGMSESLLVAIAARRPLDTLGLVSYAIVIDATVIGGVCAMLALTYGLVASGLGHVPRFRDLAPVIGTTAILAVGSVLALKWAQLTARDATIPNPFTGQLLIVVGTLLVAVVAFAALSTSARWPHRPVVMTRRAVRRS